jgi:hypothetical protein
MFVNRGDCTLEGPAPTPDASTPASMISQDRGDPNGNGNIDIVDPLLIAQYYVGLISEFC